MQKGRKQKIFGWSIFDYDYKKESTAKKWVDKGTKIAGESKKLFKIEGIQIYSIMS